VSSEVGLLDDHADDHVDDDTDEASTYCRASKAGKKLPRSGKIIYLYTRGSLKQTNAIKRYR